MALLQLRTVCTTTLLTVSSSTSGSVLVSTRAQGTF
jgi:hypothetical protein